MNLTLPKYKDIDPLPQKKLECESLLLSLNSNDKKEVIQNTIIYLAEYYFPVFVSLFAFIEELAKSKYAFKRVIFLDLDLQKSSVSNTAIP